MNEEIDGLLRALADEDARMKAPPHVETAVMREWRSRRSVVGGWWLVARRLSLAAAALLIMAFVLGHNARIVPTSTVTKGSAMTDPIQPDSNAAPRVDSNITPQPRRLAAGTAPRNAAVPLRSRQARATSHQPLPTRQQDSSTSHQPPTTNQPYVLVGASSSDPAPVNVVRLRMARSALATLGLPLPNPDAAALVDVDVFVGEDGIARAIRPIALVSSASQE